MLDRRGPPLSECEHIHQRFSALLSRDGIVRVAEDADGPTTQYGGGELRDVLCRAADVDQPSHVPSAIAAAAAGSPKTGSITTSAGAPTASMSRVVRSARVSLGCSTTTSSAPAVRARRAEVSDRQTATTRAAWRCRATARAT